MGLAGIASPGQEASGEPDGLKVGLDRPRGLVLGTEVDLERAGQGCRARV